MNMAEQGATPLRFYGPGDLARLETAVREPLQAWAARWLLAGAEVGPAVANAYRANAAASSLRCRGTSGGAWVGAAGIGDMAGGLARALFGSQPVDAEPRGALVAVAELVLDDLVMRLLEQLAGPPTQEPAAWVRPAGAVPAASSRGDVELQLTLAGQELQLIVGVVAAIAFLDRGSPRRPAAALPVSRQTAVEGARVALQATLAPVELALPDLLAMREGDVVLFPHPLDEPVLVRTHDGKPVARALIGSREGRRAAQLIDSR
jgi:hypothetical protein